MDVLIQELIRTALLAITLGVLIAAGRLRVDLGGKGWRVIVLGFALLLGASTTELVRNFEQVEHLFTTAAHRKVDVVLYVLVTVGFVLIGVKLVSFVAGATAADRTKNLSVALSTVRNELYSGQAMLRSVLKSSLSGVMVFKAVRDATGALIDLECELMNGAAEQILGRPSHQMLGGRLLEQLPAARGEGLFADCTSVISSGLPLNEERRFSFAGKSSWIQAVAVKLGDGCALTLTEITDRKRAEERLRHAAEHDVLTGLANRARFMERLETCLHRAKNMTAYRFAVLYLDFDRFKIINDSLGHKVGDGLLISIADRLRSSLGYLNRGMYSDDGPMPARLGGDEFVVLLDSIADEAEVDVLAHQLHTALYAPHIIEGNKVTSTASIGVVIADGRYDRAEDIIRDADIAMYEAKRAGRARHIIFDDRMHRDVVHRMTLEKELRDAVEAGQFQLVYEPIVCLESGDLVGFEALIRWPHPTRGLIRPGEFIHIAEELDLIVRIGDWVMADACRTLKDWQARFPNYTNLIVSVNLSKRQLMHQELINTIINNVERSGIRPECLMLEITESMVMDERHDHTPVLNAIRNLGVKLAMDDFGTGHSSLSALHRFPIDVLKIDQSFIASEGKKRLYAAIVHVVVELARNLEMHVVAEGIERQEHLSLLQGLACNYGQGHLFGDPMTSAEVEQYLAGRRNVNRAA